MFNFCKYICYQIFFFTLGNNESKSHTNILRRSEMQMFFLNNRFEMEGKQYSCVYV